ncbi:MAG: cytochrome d ubiquinol oxidase subunit II [Rectinemataceae bacterium]|nr:cytochrome d ubiquinol oxidase subunit II [Rectinemataceae bacterium]
MTPTFWQSACYILLFALFAGFTVLDGFDLGISMMLPFFSKKDSHKTVLLNSIWPFWDGNELWGLAAGILLFAAFPAVYAQALSVFYLPVLVFLVCLIYRAVAFELWFHLPAMRRLWEASFMVCSLLLSFMFGVLTGGVIAGIPVDESGRIGGDILAAAGFSPVVFGGYWTLTMLLSGAAWLTLKSEGEVRAKAIKVAKALWLPDLIFMILVALAIFLLKPEAMARPLVWIGFGLALYTSATARLALAWGRSRMVFIAVAATQLALWLALGAAQFPVLVQAREFPERSITAINASSPEPTLRLVALLTFAGGIVIVAYTTFVYRSLKGKAGSRENY